MRRPRLLVLLAVVSLLLGVVTITTATSTLMAFTGSRDAFTKGVVESDPKVYELLVTDKDSAVEAKNRADLQVLSPRRAEVLWSRRGVLLPLEGFGLLVGLLITLGAPRAVWGAPTRRRWGLSAWQLGAMVGLPYELLEALTAHAQVRDIASVIPDLTSPFALQTRAMATTWLSVAPQAIAALLLASAAIYLSGADARAWADEKA